MTKSKKLLSVFLAVVMVLSTFTVGFYAIAADEGETASDAVTDVQSLIDKFRENYAYLFNTNEQYKDRHEQAVKDFDAATEAMRALTEEEKLELNQGYYGFMLYYATQTAARSTDPTVSNEEATLNRLD